MKAATVLVFLCACVAEAPTYAPMPAPSPPADPQPDPPKPDPFALMVQPRLGQVVSGDPAAAVISVVGVTATPGAAISVQVPTSATSLEQWTTIATVIADTVPSPTDTTVYEWHTTVAPSALDSTRWPAGGLLHLRAVDRDDQVLPSLFHDSDACLAQVAGWRDRATRCAAALDSGAVIVNTAVTLLDPSLRPRFLDRRGFVDTTETSAYYQAIAAPTTLADFRTTYGFAGNEITTVYYNAFDLGIGRGMHCAAQAGGGLACYVSNYGTFGGDADEALTRAVAGEAAGGTGAFASVAMVYQPPIDAPNAVRFIVYGATGALATSATLDTIGDNTSIPNNCLNCHGAGANYDSTAHAASGAHFLPFDAAAMTFSTQLGDQTPTLAKLNTFVAAAGATPTITSVTTDPSSIPSSWSATTLDREVYRNVTATSCRNCHASLDSSGPLAFTSAADFRSQAASIAASICNNGRTMPNAEVPFQRFWNGPARAYLAAYLGVPGSCGP
jgi:hypothetical protein